jgi:anti-sigma regulatory factor (Ser/Thr protein kinase)
MSTRTASIDLPPSPISVPTARHLVDELLRAWHVPHDRQDAALLVTELVSNVVDHAGSTANFTLELTLSDAWLRVSVADGSAIQPIVREMSQDRPRGRGMIMVQAIADRWGSEEHRGGKRVWFELRPSAV